MAQSKFFMMLKEQGDFLSQNLQWKQNRIVTATSTVLYYIVDLKGGCLNNLSI